MAIPYLSPPPETATDPVHSTADLRQRWLALMAPLGFGERLLRIGFVGADRCMIKMLSEVPLGPRPKRRTVEPVMVALRDVLDGPAPGMMIALLLTRPGRGPISSADRQWAALLTEVAAEFEIPLEPIFRANDEALVHVEGIQEAIR